MPADPWQERVIGRLTYPTKAGGEIAGCPASEAGAGSPPTRGKPSRSKPARSRHSGSKTGAQGQVP